MFRVALIATAMAVALGFCVAAAAEPEPAGDFVPLLDESEAPAAPIAPITADVDASTRPVTPIGGDETAPPPRTAPIPMEPIGDTGEPARFLFFTGTDAWHNGAFMHGGFLWAPQNLDTSGPVFKLLLNAGIYRYRSGVTEFMGGQLMGAALPGWRFKRGAFELTVFAGLDVQEHRFIPFDPGNRLAGMHIGARAGFDAWFEPIQNGMVTASASISTIGSGYWTRAAAGWRFFDSVWIGPEVHASGDDVYRQLRFGAHITSLKVWNLEWSAAGGWVTANDGRDGVYGRLGVLVRR